MPRPDEFDDEVFISSRFADDAASQLPNARRWIRLGIFFFILFLLYHNVVPLYTDWLWFGEVGYRNVFATTILTKTALFFIFASLFFAIFFGNTRLTRRFSPERNEADLMERYGPIWGKAFKKSLNGIEIGVAGFLSLWAGRLAAEQWATCLEFNERRKVLLNDEAGRARGEGIALRTEEG